MAHDTSWALVTGGSSGIGLEIARCFARDGHPLIVVAHDRARLEDAAAQLRADGAPQVEPWSIDLSKPEGAPTMFAEVRKRGLLPDHLVLNAGTGAWGNFVGETDLALELESIQVNIVSTVHAAKLFLPEMVARGSGRVLVTSSLVAAGAAPRLAVYSGTKAFLHHFAEAVREEILGSGVTITTLMPDLTESRFFERAHVDPGSVTAQQPKADPAQVARAGYDAMLAGKQHVVAPFLSRFKAVAAKLLPEELVTKITRAE